MAKKRTKQTQKMVDYINQYLKRNRISDCSNEVALVFSNALIMAETYEGYNTFREVEIDGKKFDRLTGGKIDDETFIKFY